MVWTQSKICAWARDTFCRPGEEPDKDAVFRKFMTEILELHEAWFERDPDAILKECADVNVMLMQVCALHGGDLVALTHEVMESNTKRSWRLHGDGTAQHTAEGE